MAVAAELTQVWLACAVASIIGRADKLWPPCDSCLLSKGCYMLVNNRLKCQIRLMSILHKHEGSP